MRAPEEICRLEEHRQAVGIAEVSVVAEELAGGWMCFSEPDSWTNQACGMGLDGPVSAEELDRLVAFYAERGVEPKLELAPFSHATLLAGLAARGFQLREFETVMAREVGRGGDLRGELPTGWPEGLEIEVVDETDAKAIAEYVRVTCENFTPEGEDPSRAMIDACHRVALHERTESLLARIGGEVVGGGGLDVLGEVACLIGAATAPAFRGRGIQQALFAARSERALELGASLVCVHSRPGIPTERNATRLGFATAYTKVVMAMPGEGLLPSP